MQIGMPQVCIWLSSFCMLTNARCATRKGNEELHGIAATGAEGASPLVLFLRGIYVRFGPEGDLQLQRLTPRPVHLFDLFD